MTLGLLVRHLVVFMPPWWPIGTSIRRKQQRIGGVPYVHLKQRVSKPNLWRRNLASLHRWRQRVASCWSRQSTTRSSMKARDRSRIKRLWRTRWISWLRNNSELISRWDKGSFQNLWRSSCWRLRIHKTYSLWWEILCFSQLGSKLKRTSCKASSRSRSWIFSKLKYWGLQWSQRLIQLADSSSLQISLLKHSRMHGHLQKTKSSPAF